jgi:hypothetical protein
MNLEQIVKETVAKFVAEKQGKDLTGDGKIDSADYLQARSNAIEKTKGLDEASIPSNVESLANKIISWYEKHPNQKMQADRLPAVEKNIEYLMSKTVGNNAWDFKTFEKAVKAKYPLVFQESQEINEDYEVAMAQDSLDSIIRAAMMLKAEMGDREVNLPAWIQDHITNSENYINQAAKGYHESDAQIANHAGEEDESMYEARFKKGEDVGGKGFEFKDIAKKAAKQYGSEEAGKRVAGAIMKKVLNKEGEVDEVFKPKSSFDDYSIGDNVTVAGKKAKITNMKMDDESGERRARVRFEDGTAKEVSINTLDENTMTTNEGRSAEDIKQAQIEKAYDHLEKMKEKPRLFSSEDIKKAEARIDKLEAELDALAAKSTNESLDEATVRRWQHYAGIK